jgi:hypothetical protein
MLSRFQVTLPSISRFTVPGAGLPAIFRRQMRCRCPFRDLIWMTVLVISQYGLALGLQPVVMGITEFASDTPRFWLRLLTMSALVAPLLYLPAAAILGAFAAPPISQFEETQSILMTRLTAFDVCAGRLLASLWPALSAILASCGFSLAVQLVWRPGQLLWHSVQPASPEGYGAILQMHLVLLMAVLAIGAIGYLFAIRRRPGRVWARGASFGLGVAALAIFGLFLVDSRIRTMQDPTGLINGLLAINPATAAAAALGADVLRFPFPYNHTVAPEYPFIYPPTLLTCGLYLIVAVCALGVSSIRLRRAYR